MTAAAPAARTAPARDGGPRILFQSHNRRGLGHMMRALNIAREIRVLSPDARIVLHTRAPSTGRFCPPDVEWVLDAPGDGWHDTLRRLAPDVVVYDTMIPADPAAEPVPVHARVAYVMRRCTDERHDAICASGFLDRVDVAVIPHDPAEFDRPVPAQVAGRATFTGPIVRRPTTDGIARMRDRHALGGAGFVLVSSAGGGGFAETAEPFFDAVWAAHARLADARPGLRHVVVLGPHARGGRTPLPGMRVVESEPDLVELFAAADLVVSEAGYNSVNELRLVGVPACFVPGARRWDDQAQRVRAVTERGLAFSAPPGDPESVGAAIAAVASDDDLLARLRRASAAHPLDPGNGRAARAILDVLR